MLPGLRCIQAASYMNDLTRQLIALIRKLRHDVHQALEELRLIQQVSDSHYEQYSSDRNSDTSEKDGDVLAAIKAIQDAKDSAEAKKYALDHRRYRLEWKGYRISRLTTIFLFFYTTLTLIIAGYSIRSANAAKSSADTAVTSIRPWVGLEDNIIENPVLVFGQSFPALTPRYKIKNFGKTPAVSENDSIQALTQESLQEPQAWEYFSKSCRGQMPRFFQPDIAKASWFNSGQMIFPGQVIQNKRIGDSDIPIKGSTLSNQSHLANIWLFVCITYWQGTTEHHSRYLFQTTHQPPVETPIPGHPGATYLPITGVWLKDNDGD
jgi:hypothetical protein